METKSSEVPARTPPRRRLALRMAVLYFLVCLAYAGRSGFRDYRHDHVDFEYWYVEGACFLHGESPFNRDAYQARWAKAIFDTRPLNYEAMGGREMVTFAFLPTQAILMAPLALLRSYTARHVFSALSFLSLLIILYLTGRFLVLARVCRWDTPLLWAGLGTACSLNSGVPAVLYVGQPTVLAMAGTMGVVYYWLRKRTVLAALCVIASSFKPPVGACSLVNLFCRGAYAPVVYGAVFCGAISLGSLATTPHEAIVPDVVKAVKYYYVHHPMSKPPNVTGIVSLVYLTFLRLPTICWILAGMLLSALAGWRNRNEPFFPMNAEEGEPEPTPARRLGNLVRYDGWYLPFLITGLFVQLKLYDSIIYTPIIVGAFAAGSWRGLWYAPGLLLIARIRTFLALAEKAFGTGWFESMAQTYGTQPGLVYKWVETLMGSVGIVWVVLTHIVLKWAMTARANGGIIPEAGGSAARSGQRV